MGWRASAVSMLVAVLGACRCAPAARPGGCGPQSGEVRVAIGVQPNTLDWSASSAASADNYPVLLAAMYGLTRLDDAHRVVPGLAERWEVVDADDGTQRFTFHLRPGLVWSDGETPVTAHDFVFGWRRALLGNEPAEFMDIVGAEEVLAARGGGEDAADHMGRALEGFLVRALDKATLQVTLRSPRSYFLSRLANVYTFFPQPKRDLDGKSPDEIRRYFHSPDHGRPLVTGAFRIVAWDRLGRTVRMERNPFDPFPPGPGAIQKVLLVEAPLSPILYERCQVDFLLMDDPSTLARPDAEVQKSALLSVFWLGMNATLLPHDVRLAIAHAIDRTALVDGLLPTARLAETYLPPAMPGAPARAPDTYPKHDPALARAMVEKAGFQGRELTLLVRGARTFLPEKGIADAIRRQLAAVGLNVRVVETSNFTNDIRDPGGRVRHALFLKRVGADYAHPQTLFTPFQADGINYTDFAAIDGGARVRAFQALLDAGARAADPAEAREVWARADEQLVAEDAVLVPLLYPERYYRRRLWVAGLGVDPFNFLTLRSVRVDGALP